MPKADRTRYFARSMNYRKLIAEVVAQAIREAEASARNEALEEAARMFEADGDLLEAASVRNLKTKG